MVHSNLNIYFSALPRSKEIKKSAYLRPQDTYFISAMDQ